MTLNCNERRISMKNKRFSISILLIFCILFSLSSALASTGYITANSLNMRKSASTDSKVITVLHDGQKVTITGTSGSWYKVTCGKYSGYVSKNYVSKSNSSTGNTSDKSTSSSNKVSTSTTLKKGSSGTAVKNLQNKLKKLGYYSGTADGNYGSGTENAVKKFQKAKGLSADGVAGPSTLKAINNTNESSDNSTSSGNYVTEKLNWFNGGSKKIPKGAIFQVKDCLTGKVFTCKRWSGGNHIDAEPKTGSDTKVLKSIYGHWSWRRRPVLVKYNGHVYAGSMNGMPHGTQTISNNNFDGHFCIHFTGSKTHGSQKVDQAHQDCVKKALKYSW